MGSPPSFCHQPAFPRASRKHRWPALLSPSFWTPQLSRWVAHLCWLREALTGKRATLLMWVSMHISDLSGGLFLNAKWDADNASRISVRGRGTSMCDIPAIPRCGLIWPSCQSCWNRPHLHLLTKEEDEAWRCGPNQSWWVGKPVFNSGLLNPEPKLSPLSKRSANRLTFTCDVLIVYAEEGKRSEPLLST